MKKGNALQVFNSARVLITGHTGFKGSWLSLWMSELGAEVYGLSKSVPTTPSHYECTNIKERVKNSRIDICDFESVKSYVNKVKPDFIFHLAAQPIVISSYKDPIGTFNTNTIGTINLLESLRSIDFNCVAVLITSDKCYENQEWVWGYKETDRLGGADPYSASKAAAEIAINCYVKSFFAHKGPLKLGIGRAGNVIGGGDWAENRIVPDCMRAASQNKPISLRNPNSTRPWQHVLEPLSGYINLAIDLQIRDKCHGAAFNFAALHKKNYTVKELVEKMSSSWEDIKSINNEISINSPYESQNLQLNCDKARSILNWNSVWDLQETVENTVRWYKYFYESNGKDMQRFSIEQIANYVKSANEKSLAWSL